MKIIYVCSQSRGAPPYSAYKIEYNLIKAAEYCAEVVRAGHIPIAPHLYFQPFLSDLKPGERAIALPMGKALLQICAEVWVFGKTISEGMQAEIALAEKLSIPVVYKSQEG